MAESVAKLPVNVEKAIELLVRAGSVASVREDITRFIKAASLAGILMVVLATLSSPKMLLSSITRCPRARG